MRLSFTESQQKFRAEVQQFFQTEERGKVIDRDLNYSPSFYSSVGARGWLGMRWPKRYGGQERGFVEELIFKEEAGHAAVPLNRAVYYTSITLFGDFCLAYGNQQQKEEYLPKIASGDMLVARGWTEPDAGYDLASVKTTAVVNGNHYVVNGQKQFSTGVPHCDYIFLMVRTGIDLPQGTGISLLIVDMKTPGITVSSIEGIPAYSVYLDNVRVPRSNLVGEENRALDYITEDPRFRYEANLGFSLGEIRVIFDMFLWYIKSSEQYRPSPLKHQLIRHTLAELEAELEVCRLLSYRVASMRDKGLMPDYEVHMAELTIAELFYKVAVCGMDMVELHGLASAGSQALPFISRPAQMIYNSSKLLILPGSSEIHRNAIAYRGLGLPTNWSE